jgi:hypothetical protein
MSGFNHDYEDVLRHALRAAAESVEPSGDGLERIRERLGSPPMLSFASVTTWCSDATLRFTGWAEPAIAAFLDFFWATIDRFRPPAAAPGHTRPRLGWLRPVAAMGTAIFVVAAGAFAILTTTETSSTSGNFLHGRQAPRSGGGPGQPATHNSAQPYQSTSPAGLPGATAPTSPASTKCSRYRGPLPGGTSPAPGSTSPSPSTSASTSPTTTPTTSPTVTPTPTPTPTDSSTTGAGSGGTQTPTTSTAPSTAAGLVTNLHLAKSTPQATRTTTTKSKSPSPSKTPCPSGALTGNGTKSASLGQLAPVGITVGGPAGRLVAADPADENS